MQLTEGGSHASNAREVGRPKVVGVHELRVFLGISRQRVYQLSCTDDFPKPLASLSSGKVWLVDDIRVWARNTRRWAYLDTSGLGDDVQGAARSSSPTATTSEIDSDERQLMDLDDELSGTGAPTGLGRPHVGPRYESLLGVEMRRATRLEAGMPDRLARAEVALYEHLKATPGGLCAACFEPEPCHARYAALDIFAWYGVLPRRRPGTGGVWSAIGSQNFYGFAVDQTRSNDAM